MPDLVPNRAFYPEVAYSVLASEALGFGWGTIYVVLWVLGRVS